MTNSDSTAIVTKATLLAIVDWIKDSEERQLPL
jgi:hypothetical protein